MTLILLMLCTAISTSTFADTSVPALTPGTSEYSEVKTAIDTADKTKYARILDFKFMGVAGKIAIVKDKTEKNDDDLAAVINGQYYRIPTDMTMIDNFKRFFSLNGMNGTTAGIYLTQTGFKWNYLTDGYERATATVRLADLAGNVLQNLEFEETTAPATGPGDKELHPWDQDTTSHIYRNNSRTAASPRRRTEPYPDFLISDANIFMEISMKNYFNDVPNQPEYWPSYRTWDFAGMKAQGLDIQDWSEDLLWFFNVNDRYFMLPFNFEVFDNWTSLISGQGPKPGTYLIQRGFIHNAKGELRRVVAQVRLSDESGQLLKSFEYHEDHFDTKFADAETMTERLY